jgi:hypothetical protein
MTTAQVMTMALVAVVLFHGNQFHGNQDRSRLFLMAHGYISPFEMVSKNNFNRRLHQIPEVTWMALFSLLAQINKETNIKTNTKKTNSTQEYAVDSLPVPVCDNIRIQRCRLYPRKCHGEAFRGYVASKRRLFLYSVFYGLRVHLVITTGDYHQRSAS